MPTTILDYLQAQKRDFVRAFNDPAAFPVGVGFPGQGALPGRPMAWRWDESVPDHRAFVRTAPGTSAEYWVHVDLSGYRAAFLAFLAAEFALPSEAVLSHWHADHVLNRAFARRHGIAFVRMALVAAEFNTGHGRTIERGVTRMPASGKSMYLLDYYMMMKVLGIHPPSSEADYRARRVDIARRIVGEGVAVPESLVLEGLDGMFLALWPVLRPS